MNRERDSEVVYELVTSKYKIAERNRLAKYRFLTDSENELNLQSKHRCSEPSLAQTEKAEVKRVDLSVPGTPVSSRYLESLRTYSRKLGGGIETDDEEDYDANEGQKTDFHSALTEGLKQFTSDMEKLKSHDMDEAKKSETPKKLPNPIDVSTISKKEVASISKIDKYFQESARRGSLTRDFTEVVQIFDPRVTSDFTTVTKPGTPISSRLIKAEKVSSKKLKPFTDNMKKLEGLKSSEAVQSKEDSPPQKPKRVNPMPISPVNDKQEPEIPTVNVIPATPLDPKDFPPILTSSTKKAVKDNEILIIVEQVDADVNSDESDKENLADEKVSSDSADKDVKSDETQSSEKSVPSKTKEDTQRSTAKDEDQAGKSPKPAPFVFDSRSLDQKSNEPVKPSRKFNDSSKNDKPPKSTNSSDNPDDSKPTTKKDLSVPGTPVDSRKIFNTNPFEDDSDLESDIEVIESSEVKELAKDLVDKIESLVQKTLDEKEEEFKTKVSETTDAVEGKEKDEKLLIIHEDKCKVKEYFDKSEKVKSYQRTFSEIDRFNEPPMDVKEKVEKYFKESQDKKSYTRGFSEAINYVEPVDIEELLKPGTPVSSKVVECMRKSEPIDEEKEVDPIVVHGMEAFKKARDALHNPEFKVNAYFKESEQRHTLKRDFSEVYGELGGPSRPGPENPEIKKFFEQSDAQKSFHRQFSEVVQTLPPRIKDILPEEKEAIKTGRSSRLSVFSAPDPTESNPDNPANPSIVRKHGKKYGVDKYFAASLYRTAYHRSKNQRRGSEPDHRFAIVEDEYVFGENDVLRGQVFQDDDQTPIHPAHHKHSKGDEENKEEYDQQNVQFWRDFLKPYNLNLPTDIIMRDELIDKYTKYTLE